MHRRLPVAAAVSLMAGVVFAAVAGPGAAAAAAAGVHTSPTGYDISYPQCGHAYPSSVSFGLVGVNGGVVYTANPCTPGELNWAKAAGNHSPSFYANTADPGPAYSSHWPAGQQSPQICDGVNTTGCSYDYGWNAAQDSFADAVKAETTDRSGSPTAAAAAAPWWLDVETGNSWETLEATYGSSATSDANDRAALQGEIAFFSSAGVSSIGVYSTTSQWTSITGGTGSTFAGSPAWLAGYATLSKAKSACGAKSFTGGPVALAQYPSGGFDADYACP